MGKLINLNGDADKNKTLQKILEQLDTLKDSWQSCCLHLRTQTAPEWMPLQRLWMPWKTLQN